MIVAKMILYIKIEFWHILKFKNSQVAKLNSRKNFPLLGYSKVNFNVNVNGNFGWDHTILYKEILASNNFTYSVIF